MARNWLAGLDDSLDISHYVSQIIIYLTHSHITFRARRGARRDDRASRDDRDADERPSPRRRAPPPVGPRPWPPPPSIDDTSDLRESARVRVLEVERIAKRPRARERRVRTPVRRRVATRESTDDRPPRARPHAVRRGTDRGQVIDSERKARREAGLNIKKRRAGGETAESRKRNEISADSAKSPPQAAAHAPAGPSARARDSHSDSTLPPPSIPDFHIHSTVEINAPVLTAAVA